MQITIKQPETPEEWLQYYDCRWRLLRQPWHQAKGSEKDELEEKSIHRLALLENQIIAVGRLYFSNPNEAQIRYMAVIPEYQHKGIGLQILQALESEAVANNITTITLNARESAIPFYQKNKYKTIGSAHTLYDVIKHKKMVKKLS